MFAAVKLLKMPIQINILIWDMVLSLILFDVFSCSGFDWGKKFIIFGVNNRSSMQIDNKKKDILALGEDPIVIIILLLIVMLLVLINIW